MPPSSSYPHCDQCDCCVCCPSSLSTSGVMSSPLCPSPPLYLYRSCRCHIHQPPTDWFQSCVEHFSMSLLHLAFLPKMKCSCTKTPHDLYYKRINPRCMVICLQCPGLALVYSFCCVRSARLIPWVMCPWSLSNYLFYSNKGELSNLVWHDLDLRYHCIEGCVCAISDVGDLLFLGKMLLSWEYQFFI